MSEIEKDYAEPFYCLRCDCLMIHDLIDGDWVCYSCNNIYDEKKMAQYLS